MNVNNLLNLLYVHVFFIISLITFLVNNWSYKYRSLKERNVHAIRINDLSYTTIQDLNDVTE